MTKNIIGTILIVITIILLFIGCAGMLQRPDTHTIVKPDEFGKKYSPQELKSDLKMLIDNMEAVHPNLYANISKSKSIHYAGFLSKN